MSPFSLMESILTGLRPNHVKNNILLPLLSLGEFCTGNFLYSCYWNTALLPLKRTYRTYPWRKQALWEKNSWYVIPVLCRKLWEAVVLPERNGVVLGTTNYQLRYHLLSRSFFFPLHSIKVMSLLLSPGLVFHPGTANTRARCPKHTLPSSGSFFFIKQPEPAFLPLYTLHCCFEQTLPDEHFPRETPPPPWVRTTLTPAWTIPPRPQIPAGLLLSSLTNLPSASS